ncbi:MAG: hypothetical protein ACOZIN_19430, partial [Myxococcota bacterium]
ELGFPVDWSKSSHWRRVGGTAQCGPGTGGNGVMAYNYDLSNSCSHTTWQWFRGQSYSVRSVGELKTKPFAIPSSGGNIQFYQRSQTEQVYGFDVRTVYLDSPTVGRTQFGQWCGPKAPNRQLILFCADQGSPGNLEYAGLNVPSAYWGKNDVSLVFEFDSVDGLNNGYGGWWVDQVRFLPDL